MSTKTKRINARISNELDRLLNEMANAQGVSLSEVVISALTEFCERESAKHHKELLTAFRKAGLVGCFKGARGLARQYKNLLDESMDAKWR